MKEKKVFKAHKEITKSDSKKLKPLTNYWHQRLIQAMISDNWRIAWIFALLGFALGLIAKS